jgi:hypothetical protein
MPYKFWSLPIGRTEKARKRLRAIGNETIKNYLLGSLEESRKTQLEEQLLNDAQLFEELLIAEDELVDHYVAGRLSVEDKARFESYFLATPDRIRKTQFGRAFHKYLERNDTAEAPAAVSSAPFRNQSQFWKVRRPVFAFAALAVVCLLSLGLYWSLFYKDFPGSNKPHVITLAAGISRSVGAGFHRETIPADASTIELRLVVSEIRHRSYNAAIRSATTTIENLTSSKTLEQNGEKSVVFSVEAKRLPPDDYQVKLTGTDEAGETEIIDSYSFGITRR